MKTDEPGWGEMHGKGETAGIAAIAVIARDPIPAGQKRPVWGPWNRREIGTNAGNAPGIEWRKSFGMLVTERKKMSE